MINKKRARSSSLFLMELILAILFFSIASAVCVQFFVNSHLLCTQSQALNHAVNECTSVAECLSVTAAEDLTFGTQYTYYDSDFSICKKEDASYVLLVTISPRDTLIDAQISMRDLSKTTQIKETQTKGKLIYELHTSHHIPRRTEHEKN